jgi:hypothetical protein
MNGLHIGSLATVERVESDGGAKQATARGIRSSSVDVDTVHLAGWATSPENFLVMNRLDVSGVKVSPAETTAANTTICAQLPSSADLGGDALVPLLPLIPLLIKDVAILHGDLIHMALHHRNRDSDSQAAVGAVALAIAALPVTSRSSRSTPVCALLLVRETLFAGTLIMIAVAVLLRVFVYRRGSRWYHRWEPFVVDVASVAILLPLLGYGIELPPLPPPPAGVQLDRIEVAEMSGQSSAARFEIPQTTIRGLRLTPPSSNSRLEVGADSVVVPKTNIAAPPSSTLRLDAMTIDDVILVYDPNRQAVDDIAAHVRLAGCSNPTRSRVNFGISNSFKASTLVPDWALMQTYVRPVRIVQRKYPHDFQSRSASSLLTRELH